MPSQLSQNFEYVFPAISGIQAKRTFYVTMCPLHLIPRIFLFDEEEVVPQLRAQRVLNQVRVPEIARYILNHKDDYVFSALTASVDGDVRFDPAEGADSSSSLGFLRVPMSARFIINDGQHRRAAIETALNEDPDLGNETIAVVLFHDKGLKRSQQMFADLNKYAVRPSTSLGILYDHRDAIGEVTKRLAFENRAFKGIVEMEKTALSLRSRKLFTLSSIFSANRALLRGIEEQSVEQLFGIADHFWVVVSDQFPEWKKVQNNEVSASQIRQDYVHTHGVILQAIGRVGNQLLMNDIKIEPYVEQFKNIDWQRSNVSLWEGRAMHNGRLSKASTSIVLAGNAIKKAIGLSLDAEEELAERKVARSET